MPFSSSTSIAPCIRSLSDSEPTRMPTFTSATGDVRPEPHAGEIYASDGLVRGGSRRLHRVPAADDVEDAAAVRDETPVVQRRACVEHERAGGLRGLDAL